jgi:hypothetical protein
MSRDKVAATLFRFTRHLAAWCVPVLLVLGVACAVVLVQPHAEATPDLISSVEIVEDHEPADVVVVVTVTSEPRRPHAIVTSLLASPHGSPAFQPTVPPPRR